MRCRMAFLSLGVMAAMALVAMPVLAADPDPLDPANKTCDFNDLTIQTDGPVPCGDNTCITYNLSGSGTLDHIGTFVRAEATPIPLGDFPFSITTPCSTGDSVLGLDADLVCHEVLMHWNNLKSKAPPYSISFQTPGKRLPITTSVVLRKGSAQKACKMVGIGFEDTTATSSCVHQCGAFDPHQSVRKIETYDFKGCQVQFTFDLTTGEVTDFKLLTPTSLTNGKTCTANEPLGGLLSELVGPITGTNDVTFGDGWISSGNDSCTTRLVAGRYYTVCQ